MGRFGISALLSVFMAVLACKHVATCDLPTGHAQCDAILSTANLFHSTPPFKTQFAQDHGESFDVFWSPKFARGQGLSIVTTRERVEYFRPLPAVSSNINAQSWPAFEERKIPGRGRGLFANKTIYRGDRIFARAPILLIDMGVYDAAADIWPKLQNIAVDHLPDETRSKFWELYGQPVKDAVSGRIDPNAFVLRINKVSYFAVFPELSVRSLLGVVMPAS
jgi:hypothetical protein